MSVDTFNNADKNIVDVSKKRTASSDAVRKVRSRIVAEKTGVIMHEIDLFQTFARNQVNTGMVMPIFVLLIALVLSPWFGWEIAGIWASACGLSYMLLAAISRRFLSQEREPEELPSWRKRFLFGQAVISLSWVAFAILYTLDPGNYQLALIVFSTILVFQAITSMQNYAFGRSVLITAAPASAGLSVQYILSYDTALILMGVIIITSLLFFYFLADRFKRSVVTLLEHSTENRRLISELETAQLFSEEARKRAEEASLAKSRFLATMSHELRTPLNAILGFSEVMRDEIMGPIGNDTYKEYSDNIHTSGSHLLKLINEILDISRIEAGKHELEEEEIKLPQVVNDACQMIEIKAKQKGVRLDKDFEANLPPVWGDQRALHQVVLNLLSNALKFTPGGGKVTVTVGWTQKGGQYVCVTDTGPGIPEDEIPVVLSSFGQGSIAIKHAEDGTGLGLNIVQALLHMHQGKFELKSKLRIGTEAYAYLPQARVIRKSGTQRPSQQAPSQVVSNG